MPAELGMLQTNPCGVEASGASSGPTGVGLQTNHLWD